MNNVVRNNMENELKLDQGFIQKNNRRLKKLEDRITVLQQEALKLESEINSLLGEK